MPSHRHAMPLGSSRDAWGALPSAAWERLEGILERFEAAWRRGERPRVRDYLAVIEEDRRALLCELVHEDLAYRLRAGEPARVEDYRAEFPELFADPRRAVDLIAAEARLRRQQGEGPSTQEYVVRFPDFAEALRDKLAQAEKDASEAPTVAPPASPAEAITCQTSPAPPGMPAAPGTAPAPALPVSAAEWVAVAGYEVHERIGKGGMGVVYKARQIGLDRVVALKMILHGEHADLEQRERFRTESQAVARLLHPHIVQIYEVGECQGLPYFSMEFCAGGSLADQLDGTPWEARRAGRLIEALAHAMHAAHGAGIVHRDLKPANILLAEGDTPKVTDFGLARRLDQQGQTRTGAVMGTPSYMAPEQAAGKGREAGPAADVYALGAILYELLTGRPPFRAPTDLDTLLQVLGDEPVAVRTLQPKTPRDLETICHKCLQKDPQKRYSSAAALAEDLKRFAAGEAITARPTGRLERTVKWVKRRPAIAALLAVVVLVTAAGVAGIAWAYGEALSERDAAKNSLAAAQEAQRRRVLAQVEQLRTAAPAAVPGILADLEQEREAVLPRLRELWAQGDDTQERGRRMRVGLALAAVDPETVKEPLAAWMLQAEDPAEMLLARQALEPFASQFTAELWRRVHDKGTAASERFRALVALAAFDPSGAGWKTHAATAVEQLLGANPLFLGVWAEALRPVRAELVGPLGEVFRGRKLAERRLVAANVLASYVADDPRALAALAADADGEQVAVLRPLLQRHREQVIPLLERELAPLQASWNDAPLDPAWKVPEAAVVREIEAAGGMVAERFVLCQALPLERVAEVVKGLQGCGYRPTRLRPYLAGDKVRAALVWTRDGREVRPEMGLSAAAVKAKDMELGKQGWIVAEVAGYRLPGKESALRYAAVWRKAAKDEQARLLVGVGDRDFLATQQGLRKEGYVVATMQSVALPEKLPVYCCVAYKEEAQWTTYWHAQESLLRKGFPDHVLEDLCVSESAGWRKGEQQQVLGWLSGMGGAGLAAVPWEGVASEPPAWGPDQRRWYAVGWRVRPGWQDQRVVGLDAAAHRARCRELAAQGWRPAAIGVAELAENWTGAPAALLASSVWRRPAVLESDRVARSGRQATAAALLLQLGQAEPVWPLFRHTPTPDVRSHLVQRLGTHGIDAATVVSRLEAEADVTARRALILGLGEYGPEQLPDRERTRLAPRLLEWYRNDPDPGIHGAIDWLLRQGKDGPAPRKLDWGQAEALQKIDRELRKKPPDKRRWYVNGQGQTLTIIPGPVEFLMGSPATEPSRLGHEMQHQRRIGRSYAIASRAVTVEQFQRFLKDHPEVRHQYTKAYSPEPDCPMTAVTWFEAAQYCRWLSEQEGVAKEQMCYPSVEEIEKSKDGVTPLRLPPDYLARTGYRLPTEAEYEYACRAGAATAYSFGGGADLLDRYGWHLKNAADRTWPVGQKRPNDLGLFDTHGNAWAWCQESAWGYDAEGMEDKEDIRDITDRLSRALRGGAFLNQPWELRAANRTNDRPSDRYVTFGLRPARTYDLSTLPLYNFAE